METNEKSIFSFSFDETSRTHIRGISFWLQLNALAGLASAALLIVQFIQYALQDTYRRANPLLSVSGNNAGTFFIQIAVTILMNVLLYLTYRHFKGWLSSRNSAEMAKGWNTLRWYYRIYGIVMTVLILLGVLVIIFISSFSRA